MRPIKFSEERVLELFYQQKVLTKGQLLQRLGSSIMTIWRVLKRYGYLTSYNHNAAYYTLVDIPEFDAYGLWSYRDARFSRYGSLTKTVVALVFNSPSGLGVDELRELLGVQVAPVLTQLYRQGKLHREKLGTQFIYLHIDEAYRQRQIAERQRDGLPEKIYRLPEPERIIAVLVELIGQIEVEPKQLIRRLSGKGIPITSAEIEAIYRHYQIGPKKK